MGQVFGSISNVCLNSECTNQICIAMKLYVVEAAETLEMLEAQVVDRLSSGYELAGGVAYNPVDVVYIQALYLPRLETKVDALLKEENVYNERGLLDV